MKRIYNSKEVSELSDCLNVINLRFKGLNQNNKCLEVEYYPQERDDHSICIHLLEMPTDEDKDYFKLFFSDNNHKVEIEDIDLGSSTFRVWIPKVYINI